MYALYPPNPDARPREAEALAKRAKREPRSDSPSVLARADIKEAPNLFQPRFDSIVYAPGRSEGHIAALAQIVRQGSELEPVIVIAFGSDWYLIDGHHRLAAYRDAGWSKPIPVKALHSDLRGQDRVAWACEQSFADNKKNRLNISATDKVDGAWRAVASGPDVKPDGKRVSKSDIAKAYGVSVSAVANFRRVKQEILALDGDLSRLQRWGTAQNELRNLQDRAGKVVEDDYWDLKRRKIAKGLKPIMDQRPTPRELAEALEAYEPGIVTWMATAMGMVREDEEREGDDGELAELFVED